MQDDPTVLGRLIRAVRQAGAPTEESTERNGAFSYHAESHAAGIGIGVGVAAMTTNEFRYMAVLLAIALGMNRGPTLPSTKITEDLRQEPHYLVGGLGLGLLLGALI